MFSITPSKVSNVKRIVSSDEVEKVISKYESRLQSSGEKKSKGLVFARLYYDAKDYNAAKRYLDDYLSIQDGDYSVYNLMGKVLEALEDYQGALSSYKRSLELCCSQKDILIKVISLCTKCPMDPLRAKLWADKGSRLVPGDPAVFELKWYLLGLEEPKDFEEMELLIGDELGRRAREPSLHIKLVTMYMEAGLQSRAFAHCQSVQKTGAFDDTIAWLDCACNIFDYHRTKKDGNVTSMMLLALALCKLMKLHLKHSSTRVCSIILKRFDKTVKELETDGPQDIFNGLTPQWKDCVSEMKGQLYANAGIYVMKLAEENVLSLTKAKRMALALCMACWQIDAPQMTSKLFSRHSPLKSPYVPAFDWSVLACSRLSEIGHLILSMESVYQEEWMASCITDFCTKEGHSTIMKTIYADSVGMDESFLATDQTFMDVEFKLPSVDVLIQYDEVNVAEHAGNLDLIIWIGLHWDKLNEKLKPGAGVIIGRLFEGIQFEVKNMSNCHHSSICLRDVEAFIYGVIRSSKNIHIESQISDENFQLSPLLICNSLVTAQQRFWWQAAYSLYTGKAGPHSVSKSKIIIQKGLESIRCLRGHGIDPRILIYISNAFLRKRTSIESVIKEELDYKDHWLSLQKRAIHYMKEALRILEIFKNNKTIPMVEHPLILPLSEMLQAEEIASLLDKTYLKLADTLMADNDFSTALKYYEEVKSLQSVYNQAEIYILLAHEKEDKGIEGEYDRINYMKKAKEKLSVCISNADHSPEFKQTLIEKLQEVEGMASDAKHKILPKSKKSLNFQADLNATDVDIDDSIPYPNDSIISDTLEKSALEEKLEAKESEIKSLRQAIAMYKASLDMQHRQLIPPVIGQPPALGQMLPNNPPHRHIRSLESTSSTNVTPVIPSDQPQTPGAPGGGETPSDMWWDSFSPQPSFEKGYFAGLAKHALEVRDERGEVEAPTLKDPSSPPTGQSSTPTNNQVSVLQETAKSESLQTSPTLQTSSPNQTGDSTKLSPVKTPRSPAYEGCDIYVEPIVHLTSKDEILTGEEGETTKFVHRAKLYRFDKEAGQWKERGIGDVKILYNETTNKSRITMRREQVFRVCCNHVITADMKLESKVGSKAAWSWYTAADATEEEVKPEQFTIKFKTQEVADQFKAAFIETQNLTTKGDTVSSNEEETPKSSAEEVTSPSAGNSVPSTVVNPFFIPPVTVANQTQTISQVQNIVPLDPSTVAASDASTLNEMQPDGFQFSFLSQAQPAMPISTLYSFNGFTFQPQVVPAQGDSSLGIISTTYQVAGNTIVSPQLFSNVQTIHQPANFIPQPLMSQNVGNFVPQPLIAPNLSPLSRGDPPVISPPTPFFTQPITGFPGGAIPVNFQPSPFSNQNTVALPATDGLKGTGFPPFPVNNFASLPGYAPLHGGISNQNVQTPPASEASTVSEDACIGGSTPSPFSGFSFSSKPITPSLVSSSTPLKNESDVEVVTTSFPMMSSLLKDTNSVATSSSLPQPKLALLNNTNSVTEQPSLPRPTVIEGMDTLPVFEKGFVDKKIDPSSFWTSASPQKPFFSGNTVGLHDIGHKEEPRVVDEDEFFKENSKVTDNTPHEKSLPEEDYLYGDDYNVIDSCYNDGEYALSEDDYDDEEGDEFNYDVELDNQPSRASSSRRGSDDEYLNELQEDEGPVEDRFDIPKRIPNANSDVMIDADLVITLEKTPSFAQKLRASRLQLPSTFYLYELKPPCVGCRGCIDNFIETAEMKVEGNVSSNDSPVAIVTSTNNSFKSVFSSPLTEQTQGLSFAALASCGKSSFTGGSSGTFSGAGAQLFSSEGQQEGDADQEHDPHYEAVVQLKKVDTIQTGEEDDEVLFKHRAKLYRFDEKWKERGIGDIKLVKNRKTGYCRVIMRREIIHKLCANHAIMPNMELKPLHTSDSSLVWFTPSDYSEGSEPEPQSFCVKFKNKEIAELFKADFKVCKDNMMETLKNELAESSQEGNDVGKTDEKSGISPEAESVDGQIEDLQSEKADVAKPTDLRAKFAPKIGSWECSTCLINNDADANKCAACQSANPNALVNGKESSVQSAPFTFSFGVPSTQLNLFSFKAPTVGDTATSTSAFSFGMKAKEAAWNLSSQTPLSGERQPDLREKLDQPTLSVFGNVTTQSSLFVSINSTPNSVFSFGSNACTSSTPLAFGTKTPGEIKPDLRARFAPKFGSWECPTCLINNESGSTKCVACETANPGSDVSDKNGQASPTPIFGIASVSSNLVTVKPQLTSVITFGTKTEAPSGEAKPDLRARLAPKVGSWECPTCLINNEPGLTKCAACETANPDSDASNKNNQSLVTPIFGIASSSSNLFNTNPLSTSVFSFGTKTAPPSCEAKPDLRARLAPKVGSWECPTCLINNEPGSTKCAACETTNPNPEISDYVDPTFRFASPSSNGSGLNSSSAPVFSFGMNKGMTSNFSFDPKPAVSTAGFTFGVQPKTVDNPLSKVEWGNGSSRTNFSSQPATSPFVFGSNASKPVTPSNNDIDVSKDFIVDPDTWECPACLAKNNGCREICRTCDAPKQKTPVVRLDPSKFSTPINFPGDGKLENIGYKAPEPLTPPASSFSLSSTNTVSSPFLSDLSKSGASSGFFGSNISSNISNQNIFTTNNERDKELMPPPKGLPIPVTKSTPKQSEKKGLTKQDTGTSTWMPQGLNLNNLFSFGTTPSPSLSNASSIDDLSQAGTTTVNVPAAFTQGTAFTFKFDSSKLAGNSPERNEIGPVSPASPRSPNENQEDADNLDTSIEFAPLVSVVQVKQSTGEEEEEVAFTARSKMFRFDGQWKERGIGEIKILCHTISKQYRLVMRRDQTHKVCANHKLLPGMTVKPMQGAKKAFVWKTFADISDGDSKEQLFAARFKNDEIANKFANIFQESCMEKVVEPSDSSKNVYVITIPDDEIEKKSSQDASEVPVIYDSNISEKLILKAKNLLLPSSFYNIPSVAIGSVARKTHGESSTSKPVSKLPDLTLTHEKFSSDVLEGKSKVMLFPKSFYNYDKSANYTNEGIPIVIEEDVPFNSDCLYENTEYLPYKTDESFMEIFDGYASVFRFSPTANDYLKLADGRIKISEELMSKMRNILLVREDKIHLKLNVTSEMNLTLRSDSKNIYDIEGVNLAQPKKPTLTEQFALKFHDILMSEKFSSIVEESLSNLKASDTTGKDDDLAVFGAKLFGGTTSALSFTSLISNEVGFKADVSGKFQGAGAVLFQGNGESTGEVGNEDGNIYVEPIVQLENVDVTSGEEDEFLMFNQRCKLYRFDNNTKKWKERGVGLIKLLRHKETGKARVVMRRDQVHKLCANHMLLPATALQPFKSKELTVTWNAIGDVSDGPAEDCIVAARFKNEVILDEFKEKFAALANGDDVLPIVSASTVDQSSTFSECDPNLRKALIEGNM